MTTDKKTLWSPAVKKLEPYTSGEQPLDQQFIKLNTNESAFPPSPRIAKAISPANIELLRLYPDPHSQALKDTLSSYFNVTSKQIFVGNGSDEVLAHAFMLSFSSLNHCCFLMSVTAFTQFIATYTIFAMSLYR